MQIYLACLNKQILFRLILNKGRDLTLTSYVNLYYTLVIDRK